MNLLAVPPRPEATQPPCLTVRLLGDFAVRYGDESITLANTPRLQALLAYLLLHRHSPQSRQHLAFLFWPDTTEKQARSNLRTLLHRLAEALPTAETVLLIDTQTVQWNCAAAYDLDVAMFEEAVQQAAGAEKLDAMQPLLSKAVQLYTDDLLPKLYLDWLEPERKRLRQVFLQAIEKLILLLETQRDYALATQYAQRALQHDPLAEAIYHRLMRFYALNSDLANAFRTYHQCATHLRQELDLDPGPEITTLYQCLKEYSRTSAKEKLFVASSFEPPVQTPLIGRHTFWQQLQSAWHKVAKGSAHLILITGEAGMGKTRLASELVTWVERQGMATASAFCYAAEGRLAYTPIATWLRAEALLQTVQRMNSIWQSEISRLLPELSLLQPTLATPGPLTESWQRQRFFTALAHVITTLNRPLLLMLDDIQWCDLESLEWLHYLLRSAPAAQVLIMATLRVEEVEVGHPFLVLRSELQRRQQLTEVELGPLSEVETATLGTALVGQELTQATQEQLYRETEGCPLFIVEMMHSDLTVKAWLNNRQRTQLTLQLPERVKTVITQRLDQLSPSAREVLTLAAVIGRAFTARLLITASDMAERIVITALEESWRRRIIQEQDTDIYYFSHDKFRQVLYQTLSNARRQWLHSRVARALHEVYTTDRDQVISQLAVHYEQAGMFEQAILAYQDAAVIAQQLYAHHDERGHLQRALQLLTALPKSMRTDEPWVTLTRQLYERLGDLFHLTGQYERVRDCYEATLVLLPDHATLWRARLQRKVGNSWREQSQFQVALHLYEQAEAAIGKDLDAYIHDNWQEWLQIQFERMWAYYYGGQSQEIADIVRRTTPIVDLYGTPIQKFNFYFALITQSVRNSRYIISNEVLQYCRAAIALNPQLNSLAQQGFSHFAYGFNLLWHGTLDEATTQMQIGLQLAEQAGDLTLQARCLTYLAVNYRLSDQPAKVQEYTTRSLDLANRTEMVEYIGTAHANYAWLAWRDHQLNEAYREGNIALNYWQQLPNGHASCSFQWMALFPLLAIECHYHRVAEAVSYVQSLLVPSQMALQTPLTSLLAAALEAWDHRQPDIALNYLQESLQFARQMNYL